MEDWTSLLKKNIGFLCGFPLVCFVLLLIYDCFLANDVFLISSSSASRGHPYTLSFCLGNNKKNAERQIYEGCERNADFAMEFKSLLTYL